MQHNACAGFGWDSHAHPEGWYNYLSSKIRELSDFSVSHVWLPPPSQSVAPQGYMPGQLYNFFSSYGSKDELVALVKALKEAGVTPMADIVINHR